MRLPTLTPSPTTRLMTDVFRGYNHSLTPVDGELYDTENLSAEDYPALSTRKKRAVKKTFTAPGGLKEKDALCVVENGTLYVNDLPTGLTGLSSYPKQMVSMGAYLVIFPDRVYYNTANPTDFGALEATFTASGLLHYAPCDLDGNEYTIKSTGGSAPDDPDNGDVWLDTASNTLNQYSDAAGIWTSIETVYTRVTFPSQGQLPALFKANDGVSISGLAFDALNGEKLIYAIGGETETTDDYLVLVGLCGAAATVQGSVTIERKVPDMDFVVECQNRLWGCFYGHDGAQTLNEIYCCALGDFKNWRQYQGLSTDSWTASVGSDGQWTGAISYLGHPVFFKENRVHTVTVSPVGAHRIDETACSGVQKGSAKSLCVVGETLYYKGRSDVLAWQGGFPTPVGQALGDARYSGAVGGAFGGKYYLSMQGEDSKWNLFVYDTKKALWYREDSLHAVDFAAVGDELWCLDAQNRLIAMNGTEGTKETVLPWRFETGRLTFEYPDRKYLGRCDLRLTMDSTGWAQVFLEYDSSGVWMPGGYIRLTGTGSVSVPIRPRRCDHFRICLEGQGEMKLFSITKVLEVGSDV